MELVIKVCFMLVFLVIMVLSMIGFMFWIGNGVLFEGSGSKLVFYVIVFVIVIVYGLFLLYKCFIYKEVVEIGFKGMGELFFFVIIVLLLLMLGNSFKVLGMGVFVVGIVGEYFLLMLIVFMLFIVGVIMLFIIGILWGMFVIFIFIGVLLI